MGIGSSAGGLTALERFFDRLPASTGMAFLVVSHQSPIQPSYLGEILAKRTAMRVVIVEDRAPLAADCVYLAPPGRHLVLREGAARTEAAGGSGVAHPVDALFCALAAESQERAVAIVLSGTGNDGTRGLVEVKGAGGIVLAQDSATAEYPGMPSSAIATGLVNLALPPEELAARLVELASRVGEPSHAPRARDDAEGLEDLLRLAIPMIRHQTGRDLSAYKKPTLLRRIARRMAIHRIDDPAEYARLLRDKPHEIDVLLREMLIGVTSFFRDPKAFEALKRALGDVVAAKSDRQALRIWVPGCSTGEEAYSIAMLARECMKESGHRPSTQIFATDVDPHAIEVARAGRYPGGVAADVGPARLAEFFTREDNGGYRVDKSTRELIVFAVQDVTIDPPFTRLDLVSCRNLMIYLEPALQTRVLALFHYGLRPGGILFLGGSESAGALPGAFTAVDKDARLFAPKPGPIAVPPIGFEQLPVRAAEAASDRPRTGRVVDLIKEYLLREYGPAAAVVVNEQGDVVYVQGRTGAYLEPASGEPKNNVFAMAREGLGAVILTALRTARGDRATLTRHEARVKAGEGFDTVLVAARAVTHPEALRGLYLLSFERPAAGADVARARAAPSRRGARPTLKKSKRSSASRARTSRGSSNSFSTRTRSSSRPTRSCAR